MKLHLVCNAKSGGGTGVGAVEAALRARGADLTEDDPERVVVAGGDGTVGQGAELAARLGVPLAVIPTGTANDFAREHALPNDLDEAAQLAVTGTTTSVIELGRADGRAFVNLVAAGLSPAAARRSTPLRGVLGPLAYLAGAVLVAVREQPVRCGLVADGESVFDGKAWQVMVACTGAFGGGAGIDHTDPHDGCLDVVVVPAGSRLALLRYGAALRRGNIAVLPDTIHVRAEVVELDVSGGSELNLDGELIAADKPVRLTVDPEPVHLVSAE